MKKKGIKRTLYVFPVFLIVLGFSLFCSWTPEAAAAPEKIRLSFGGSNTGTWIYMFCATVADCWKRYIPGLEVTVLATAGTTANYIPLDKGELDIGGGSSSGDWYATHGMYFTKNKLTNFCTFLPASKGFYHLFTYEESPIKAWKDLDGKRVQIGARASPTSINSEEICAAIGIKPKYVYSTPGEAIDMMKDRRVDAMIYGVGAPWSGIMDLATVQKIRLITMTPEDLKKVNTSAPYLATDVIPAKTYSFQKADIHTVLSIQSVNVRPGLSEDLVYLLTKTTWQHWDEIVKSLAAAKWVKPQDMTKMVQPLHPGAARYYREIGVPILDSLIWKKK